LTAAHPITNPTIVTGTSNVTAIMAYAPNRVAPGVAAATPKITIARIGVSLVYSFISFSSLFGEETVHYDLK